MNPNLVRIGGAALALAATAAYVQRRSIRAERAHPPLGRFITIDGVNLHYLDEGDRPPLVLLHGLGSIVEDFVLSGRARSEQRSAWSPSTGRDTAIANGAALSLRRGYAGRPGAQGAAGARRASPHRPRPTLGNAGRRGAGTRPSRGAVPPGARLGACFPTLRLDALMARGASAHRRRRAVRSRRSPGARSAPGFLKLIFGPAPVPPAFAAAFPTWLALRPASCARVGEDALATLPATLRTARRYRELDLPVVMVAGARPFRQRARA